VKPGRIWRDRHGATALEFALLAPVFVLLIFGIIALGMLFWTQVGLQHGVQMAARCASVNTVLCPNSDPNAITAYATQQALGLSLPVSTFAYSVPACGNQVSASYTFQFPTILNLNPLTLTARSCFPA
jgi:Flp pilus assembly protein TadG